MNSPFGNMGATTPGNDISTTQVVIPQRCEKCHARFVHVPYFRPPRIDEKWCGSCNDDPTTDWQENEYWANSKHEPYVFAGWRFSMSLPPDVADLVYLKLLKKLPYPENPNAFLSASWGYLGDKPRLAAWLIGHWYEHLLQICPCLHGVKDQAVDEGDGSPFRQAVIESLLWYHKRGLV